MNEYTVLIASANTATLLTGGAVAVLAYRAFQRTEAAALRAVAVGFACIAVGSVLGGVLHLVGGSIALGVAVQSSFTASGCAILLYSLYAETTTTTTVTVRGSR
ncbi:hypothetical protein CV102_05300 [Natronococcus pandeyae]|uniref:Uncharacterized protein n=1 Tax=Natronococcus pandeyae TaxID=2055836 RepID=A0A8J8Q6V5_9EURY|nr:hypothetical protein [Natronococcus pandeyae]TYL39703.1 hypothetical protein CV102_05300 [Natronococcus pandeyae]